LDSPPPDRTTVATSATPITITLLESAEKSNAVFPSDFVRDDILRAGRRLNRPLEME
jgi:hypothetical protein